MLTFIDPPSVQDDEQRLESNDNRSATAVVEPSRDTRAAENGASEAEETFTVSTDDWFKA